MPLNLADDDGVHRVTRMVYCKVAPEPGLHVDAVSACRFQRMGFLTTEPVTCEACLQAEGTMTVDVQIDIDGVRYVVVDRWDDESGINLRLEPAPTAQLDWPAVKKRFDEVRKQYMDLQGVPGMHTTLALRVTFEPLAIRYNAGERSRDLYDAMAAVE